MAAKMNAQTAAASPAADGPLTCCRVGCARRGGRDTDTSDHRLEESPAADQHHGRQASGEPPMRGRRRSGWGLLSHPEQAGCDGKGEQEQADPGPEHADRRFGGLRVPEAGQGEEGRHGRGHGHEGQDADSDDHTRQGLGPGRASHRRTGGPVWVVSSSPRLVAHNVRAAPSPGSGRQSAAAPVAPRIMVMAATRHNPAAVA
ncbi:MAG: hypothetical protein QOD57_5289 [Actinomycetota bacterium]|nr:hypothetical protein [Actinomycetota bacterium]